MSTETESNEPAPEEQPTVEPSKSEPQKEKPKRESKRECPSESSPDGKHSFFFNEGTEETYCRYCGKSKK